MDGMAQRQAKGKELYAAGSVRVIDERLRPSASEDGSPKVGSGEYEVAGSREAYRLTVDAPALGLPRVSCSCPDYVRGNAPRGRCKHAFAVLAHVRATDVRIHAERTREMRERAEQRRTERRTERAERDAERGLVPAGVSAGDADDEGFEI